MPRQFFILFLWTSLNLLSQTSLTKDSFFISTTKLPNDYKTVIADAKGWRVAGRYNFYYNKIESFRISDTIYIFTPFRQGSMFCEIKGNKIVGKGDKRTVSKIIYVDQSTLILEDKQLIKIKGRDKKIKLRTRFKRVT